MHRSVVLLVLALAAAPAVAEDKVAFKTKHSEGEAFDLRTRLKMRITGNVQGQAMSMKQEGLEEYREKTLAVEDGQVTRAERAYKADEQTLERKFGEMPAQSETKKNPIAGNTVILVRKAGKVELEAKPAAGELEKSDLDFLTDDFDVLLPEEPVAVGDEWTVTKDRLAASFGGGGFNTAEATCKLEEVAEKDGAKVARIAVKVTLKGEEGGGKVTTELAGPFLFDLTAGRPLSITLKGTMKLDMGMAILEGPMEVESTIAGAK